MNDPRIIREHPEQLQELLKRRKCEIPFEQLQKADAQRREVQVKADELRNLKNKAAEQFGKMKKAGTGDSAEAKTLMEGMKNLDGQLASLDGEQAEAEQEWLKLWMRVPNAPHDSTPVGQSGADNVKLRTWGTPRKFDFKPQPHWDLGEKLGMLDSERATKLSGARFSLFMGLGARLERALIQFMLDTHTKKHGYTEVAPPILTRTAVLEGTAQLPNLADEMYHIPAPDDLWLNPTAEVPLVNIHREEILDGAKLPIKYCGYLPSFRREAGAAGKDTRGLIRVHQFDKVEMIQFVRPEDTIKAHEEMVGHSTAILEALELPYQLMALCTADISQASMRTYDPEVWMPGQDAWREIASISTCGDYQARRAQIRFRRDKQSKAELVHTLNGSGLAVGRTFAAILENYQNADGSIAIPAVLRPYLDGLDCIRQRA